MVLDYHQKKTSVIKMEIVLELNRRQHIMRTMTRKVYCVVIFPYNKMFWKLPQRIASFSLLALCFQGEVGLMQIRRDKQNIIFDTREHICINFPTFLDSSEAGETKVSQLLHSVLLKECKQRASWSCFLACYLQCTWGMESWNYEYSTHFL